MDIDLNVFYEYFKRLNEGNDDENDNNDYDFVNNVCDNLMCLMEY